MSTHAFQCVATSCTSHVCVCIYEVEKNSPHTPQQTPQPSYLIVQVAELLHQVLGDTLATVGLVVGHTVLGVEADAAHAALVLRGVLQEPIILSQVVDGVPVSAMDPGGS